MIRFVGWITHRIHRAWKRHRLRQLRREINAIYREQWRNGSSNGTQPRA